MGRKPDQRASVGVAIICKDGEATLGKCLDSVRPWVRQIVVAVDQATTDKTAKVARRHGADLIFPVQVSDWHECPKHGRILVQDFAAARNASFARLRKDLDWWLWIDADDVLVGGDKLVNLLHAVPEKVNCVWLTYNYATVHDGKGVTTQFDRERFLRTNCEWRWTHRVHETVAPVGVPIVPLKADGMYVWHQEGVHKSQSSAQRNHTLLEIELEDDPDSSRHIFYMANGLFAQHRWAEAIEWYERTGEHPKANPHERWQSYCYMSLAFEQLGNLDAARQAAWLAIDILPQYKEPYYRLGTIALLAGEADKCIYWMRQGDTKAEPPYFAFKNPMEYSYNTRSALADAHFQKGEVRAALVAAQQAHSVSPTETLKAAIIHYQELLAGAEHANAYLRMAESLADEEKVRLYELLPLSVKQFGRTRDVAVPAMMRLRKARLAA